MVKWRCRCLCVSRFDLDVFIYMAALSRSLLIYMGTIKNPQRFAILKKLFRVLKATLCFFLSRTALESS